MEGNIVVIWPNYMHIGVIVMILSLLSACAYNVTPRQEQINYELDKAYLEYSYQRDSLFVEYNKIIIKE